LKARRNIMEWLFGLWHLASGLGGPSGCLYQGYDEGLRGTGTYIGGRAELNAVEVWVLRLGYKDLAARLNCGKCGSRLGRELRILWPSDAYPPSVRMLAMTRCSGWRRHRQVAVVTESSEDLLLGPFRLEGWASSLVSSLSGAKESSAA
jgi:hypothetical protein